MTGLKAIVTKKLVRINCIGCRRKDRTGQRPVVSSVEMKTFFFFLLYLLYNE